MFEYNHPERAQEYFDSVIQFKRQPTAVKSAKTVVIKDEYLEQLADAVVVGKCTLILTVP